MGTLTQITVLCCDPDHVPVRDLPHEAGIPGGEQPTAPTSCLPKRKARQEEHSAMRRILDQPPTQTVSTCSTQKCVSVYTVFTFCMPHFVCCFITRDKNISQTCNDFRESTLFLNLNPAAGLGEQAKKQMADKI